MTEKDRRKQERKIGCVKGKGRKKRRKDKIRKMSGNHKVWGKKTKSEEKL